MLAAAIVRSFLSCIFEAACASFLTFEVDPPFSAQSLPFLQEALRVEQEACKARGQFLALVSHEIRTPLNAISGGQGLASRPEACVLLASPIVLPGHSDLN